MNEDQTRRLEENQEPTYPAWKDLPENLPEPQPETESIPQKETITVKVSADCMCFVADCPLHSEAAEMFLGLKRALDAARLTRSAVDSMSGPEAGTDQIYKHILEVIAALELPLSRLSERVVLR